MFYRADDPTTEFALGGDITERVMPGAFDHTIATNDDIVALYNHRSDTPLGRTSSGTLSIEVDEIGLRYTIDLPDTQAGNDVAESVARGDINGSSFGFTIPDGGDRYREEKGTLVRELREIDLVEVSPVVFPAYEGTSAGMRHSEAGEVSALVSRGKQALRSQRLRQLRAQQIGE